MRKLTLGERLLGVLASDNDAPQSGPIGQNLGTTTFTAVKIENGWLVSRNLNNSPVYETPTTYYFKDLKDLAEGIISLEVKNKLLPQTSPSLYPSAQATTASNTYAGYSSVASSTKVGP